MLLELVFGFVFFMMPLIGMFAAVLVKSFGKEEVEETVPQIVSKKLEERRKYVETLHIKRRKLHRGLSIGSYLLKRMGHARDGPYAILAKWLVST